LKVGDLVKLDKDQEFPADVLLLHAANGKDLVFVDTMNLDGETNLKERFIAAKDAVPTLGSAQEFQGHVECDPPHESIEEWDGNIHFKNSVVNCR
jgi:P-type E1-E2 ATPase